MRSFRNLCEKKKCQSLDIWTMSRRHNYYYNAQSFFYYSVAVLAKQSKANEAKIIWWFMFDHIFVIFMNAKRICCVSQIIILKPETFYIGPILEQSVVFNWLLLFFTIERVLCLNAWAQTFWTQNLWMSRMARVCDQLKLLLLRFSFRAFDEGPKQEFG